MHITKRLIALVAAAAMSLAAGGGRADDMQRARIGDDGHCPVGVAPAGPITAAEDSMPQSNLRARNTPDENQAAAPPLYAGPNPHMLRTYSQELALTFASPAEAVAAIVAKEPLWDGRAWAFSARWDDNNFRHTEMHDLLDRHGYKATFYLNSAYREVGPKGTSYTGARRTEPSDFRGNVTRRLMANGFSLGGHSMNHPNIPSLKKHDMFYEIAAIRVELEADTDAPVNSFVFSGSAFSDREGRDPQGRIDIVEALRRAGYHHVAQGHFNRVSPPVADTAFSLVHNLSPFDKEVDGAKFDRDVAGALDNPQQAVAQPNLTVGNHVWHTPTGLANLEASLAKYANRPDWWYCNQTEYAAYRYQFHHSRVERQGLAGQVLRYCVERPAASDLGHAIPLTLGITSATLTAATLDGQPLTYRTRAGKTLVDLPHARAQQLPTRIAAIENWSNAAAPAGDLSADDFPGLCFFLHYAEATNTLVLEARNGGPEPVTSIGLTLRLPLLWREGLQRRPLADMPAGGTAEYRLSLGPRADDPIYDRGRPYFVAQVDFQRGGQLGRIYATTRGSDRR